MDDLPLNKISICFLSEYVYTASIQAFEGHLMENNFLPERLKKLFETKRKKNGDRFTYREVSKETSLAPSYISHLVTGKRTNPSRETASALASFFGVEVDHFYKTTLENLKTSDQKTQEIAFRASRLDEGDKQLILDMIRHIEKIKQAKTDND